MFFKGCDDWADVFLLGLLVYELLSINTKHQSFNLCQQRHRGHVVTVPPIFTSYLLIILFWDLKDVDRQTLIFISAFIPVSAARADRLVLWTHVWYQTSEHRSSSWKWAGKANFHCCNYMTQCAASPRAQGHILYRSSSTPERSTKKGLIFSTFRH